VLQATSTEEARQVMSKTGLVPDIILADYHLEKETGIDCINHIRKETGLEIPAVLITADHSPEAEQSARQNSLHMLRKPIKPAALRALMMRLHPRRNAAE
jgi:CheY-like chemotaxis protein